MTSWDNLEVYLRRLVKSVGGAAYVLRDSQGRHLAPRPPKIERAALAKAFRAELIRGMARDRASRSDLDLRLILATAMTGEEAGNFRERARDESAEDILREFGRVARIQAWFEQHASVIEGAVGASFVTNGPGKRYVHRAPELPFIAERLLSSYLLIVSFRDIDRLENGGALLTIERARSTLCDMLGDLPPDGGGDQAVSNAKRLA